MPLRRVCLTLLLLVLLPRAAFAQGDCEVLSSGTTTRQNEGTEYEVISMTQAVVECAGRRRISADNIILSRASGQLSLFGNVRFQDTARTLTSNTAQYHTRSRILTAIGNALLVHRSTNSIIRAEQLDYHEKTPDRVESLVVARGGRPRAVLRREAQGDSTTLDAQEINILADDRLRGTGDALLTRDSLRAIAYVIEYSQQARVLDVTGLEARVEVPRYSLIGDSITARLGEDEQIQDVLTRHDAKLSSEDMNLTAPAAKLFFENGSITRLVSMNWPVKPGGTPGSRPHVENSQFRMDADSIDVQAPGQQITEAVAIGNAYGERITPDSMKALLPEAEPQVSSLIANDWMRGDTVRAFFAANEKAPQDTAAPARVVERLLALGKPAQSMYRMRDADRPAAKLSISYLVGSAIDVRFKSGEVVEVFSPDAVGVFLEPSEAARRANENRTRGATPPRQP